MALATKIDLSKIPVKETASKIIEANFDGTKAEYKIHALSDQYLQCLNLLRMRNNTTKGVDLYVLLLTAGLDAIDGDEFQAKYLVENCNAEAVRVGNEIYSLTDDFLTAKNKEAEEAEKNSATDTAEAGN